MLAREKPLWPVLLAILALTLLYLRPLGTGFLNDDYQFLEAARSTPLGESLGRVGALGNFYRPFSRQIYFEALSPIAGGHPLVFHGVNFAVFLAALALLADLMLALLPLPGAMAGCLYFALLPFQRVNLTWISCSQDLLALAGALGALALFRRGRTLAALGAYAVAVASKEAALPLPAALAAWVIVIERRPWPSALRRVAPFLALGAVWALVAIAMRPVAAFPKLGFDLGTFAAGYAHLIQSLLGLEHPPGMLRSLLASPPALIPLVLLAALAFWYAPANRRPGDEPTPAPGTGTASPPAVEVPTPGARPPLAAWPSARAVAGFAAVWLIAFGLVTGPVAAIWSAYYYTLAAVGGALLVGLALRRGDRWLWVGLVAALLWWHAGSSNVRTADVRVDPWVWTSHLTSSYFERGAALSAALSRQLREVEPDPPPETRFFFALLPSGAGFQMGNGALVRNLYRDPSLESFFYSEFSESTAADRPCRFLYWDGARLRPLYQMQNPFFQVGTDLLLLDRPRGAAHAFRRGLREGGDPRDLYYWMGWTELWLGRRPTAEALWTRFGARDDSLRWLVHMHAARIRYRMGDSLEARRHLIRAIESGIGRPQGHSMLGNLLLPVRPKYGLLELMVATWLDPRDGMAQRDLFLGLVTARLDEQARRELGELVRVYPQWRADSVVVQARRALERR